MGVRFLPGPFLFHSFSGKIQQSLSDIAVAPPEVLDYNFDLAVRQGGFFTNYLFQFARILAFCFLGEVCHAVLPLPVPASVYGMLLLLICLCTKVIKLDQIQETADFMLVAMPLVFVGPGVALMESFGLMKDSLLGILIISVLSTMAVMVLTGLIAQILVRRKRDKEDEFHG